MSQGSAPAEERATSAAPAPSAGQAAHIRRFETVIRVPGELTDGALALLEHRLPPGFLAMPRHAHAAAETITVLEGELQVEIARQVRTIRAGESVAIAPHVAHTGWVSVDADRAARWVAVLAPAGHERYFVDVARSIGEGGRPDMDAVLAAGVRHGVAVDLESLYELIERHELQLS